MGTGEEVRLGQFVRVRGQKATVFTISPLGGFVTVKYLSTGRKEFVRVNELQVEALS